MKPFTQGLITGALGAFLLTGAGAFVGGKLILDGFQMAKKAMRTEAAEAVEQQTFPVAGLNRLSASSSVGNVTIESGDVPDVQVTIRRIARAGSLSAATSALPDVRFSAVVTRRGTLLLRQEQRPRQANSGESTSEIAREVHFTIVIPKQSPLAVAARAGVGKVTLSGLSAPASGVTGVGDVKAQDVTGALTLEAGTGDVEIKGGKGPVTAEAGVGKVRLRGREGMASLKTGTGDIEADLATIMAKVELEAGIGGVTLTVPRKVDARIELASGIGHVTSGLANVKPEKGGSDDELVVVLGKGTHPVKATTGTGDVRLKPGD